MLKPKISPRQLLYTVSVIVVAILVVTFSGIWYTNYISHKNDQRWCSLLQSVDEAYEQVRDNPNASPAGKHIAEEFHKLRVDFSC